MRIFYDKNIDPNSATHQLSEEESKHIVRVLRLTTGDEIAIVDGKGRLFHCNIISDNPKRCSVAVNAIDQENAPEQTIHIAVCPTKQSERMEWFIEKATEIGVTEITLLSSHNSERSKIKTDRLEKKAISAMKQSRRLFLPVIHPITTLKDFVKSHPEGLIAHCYEGKKNIIAQVFKPKECPILIGPEGDFTKEEVDLALRSGYKTITLGDNRLRTETAALYAVMQAKMIIDK